MTKNIDQNTTLVEAPENTADNPAVIELLAEMGFFPADFEAEEWESLVEYYEALMEEGGELEGTLPDLEFATAAGPAPQTDGQPVRLGMDQVELESALSLDGANSGRPQGLAGGRNGGPERGDKPQVEGEQQQVIIPAPTPEPEPDPELITGTSGDDILTGDVHRDIFTPLGGNDSIIGYSGNDSIQMDRNLNVNDAIDGGDGFDVLSYTDSNGKKTNELNNVTNIERIELGNATTKIKTVDSLVADGKTLEVDGEDLGNKALIFDGRAETDGSFEITSANGKDVLRGGDGDDHFQSEGGNDKLYGYDGDDSLFGGDGKDKLWGHDGADSLDGGSGNDSLYGGEDNDSLYGRDGNDRMEGNNGNDLLFGGAGNDVMYGQSGNDSLIGESGNDKMFGGDGDDMLTGGLGADTMKGNAGNDTFQYNSLAEGGDRINSFVSGEDGFLFDGAEFDSDAGFHSSRIKGYDGTNANLGHNDATFIFDEKQNKLWYDSNGDEVGGETLIATVGGEDVDAGDIDVV